MRYGPPPNPFCRRSASSSSTSRWSAPAGPARCGSPSTGTAASIWTGLAKANRPVLDALDAVEALTGPYTLELSSPGLERPLRRPAEFRRFVGTIVSVKSHELVAGVRRHRGLLAEADDAGIGLEVDGEQRRFSYDAIASARTVFEWGPAPKPTGPAKRAAKERPLKERSDA